MAKKSSSRTATRVRYRVHAFDKATEEYITRWYAKKITAMRNAYRLRTAEVADTMAKIGSEQVWRVDEFCVTCVRRRMA